MRKTRGIFGILCVVFCMAVLLMPAKAEAASAKSKALKAYKQFLSQDISWGTAVVSPDKCEFTVAYIDNDAIPELIIYNPYSSHASGYFWLYTYKDGEIVFVDNLMDGFTYYKKKGIYCAVHSGTGGYEIWYYQYSKGNIKWKLYMNDEVSYGWDSNGDGKIKNTYEKVTKLTTPLYNSTTKTITKSAFNKQLKKLVGSKKRTTPKYYKNTAANRKKYLK